MTTAIPRSAPAGAHAHGYAKSVNGEKSAEGFEALLATFAAGAAPLPIDPRNERKGEGGAGEEPAKSPEGAIAPTATLAMPGIDVKPAEYFAANDQRVAAGVEMTRSSAESKAPQATVVDPAAGGDSSHTKPAAANDATISRAPVSPRAAVQEALVALVRSSGRPGRQTPSEEAEPPVPSAGDVARTQPPAPHASAATNRATTAAVVMPDIEAAAIPAPAAKPTASSRAAADIARQRHFALSADASPGLDTEYPAALSEGAGFQTMIALRKADGALVSDPSVRSSSDAIAPAPATTDAWIANLPSTSHAATSAAPITVPRAFDQAAWSEALARQVAASATAAARETSVRLEPEGLGPIEVRVRVEAERVDVRFSIEHPVTVNMVRAALPDLERLLAQSGMSLGQADVAQQQAGGREHAATRSPSQAQRAEAHDSAAAPVAVDARPRVRVGLLDDFV